MKLPRRRRRRPVLTSCSPVFVPFIRVKPVRRSNRTEECERRRAELGCETWIDYLGRYMPRS